MNEEQNKKIKDDGWNEMPWEEYWMRCSEWWVSLPDLWGSKCPYQLLPTTHLADFLSATGDVLKKNYVDIYIFLFFF